jgi:TPR repeat protein
LPIDPSTAFVSYSRADFEFVLRLAKDLKTKGAQVWMDKLDIRAGQIWAIAVESAMKACGRMLVILSPSSVNSSQVRAEFTYALTNKKELIPVVHRECEVPYLLHPYQFADFTAKYEEGVKALLEALGVTEQAASASAATVPFLFAATRTKSITPEHNQTNPDPLPPGLDASMADAYRKALAGDSGAMADIGSAYYNRKGARKNYAEALKWFRKAAHAGDALGMNNLGVMYQHSHGVSRDYDQAVTWYRKAADAGDAKAMCNLGFMYQSGLGVTQDDSEALKWWRKSAKAGDADGMVSLGTMYEAGQGVARDYVQAVKWYRKGAVTGSPRGMAALGNVYTHGHGVTRSHSEAVKWFQRAADAGDTFGMAKLGYLYEKGDGVEKDLPRALSLYRKAAKLGDQLAKDQLKRLGKTP